MTLSWMLWKYVTRMGGEWNLILIVEHSGSAIRYWLIVFMIRVALIVLTFYPSLNVWLLTCYCILNIRINWECDIKFWSSELWHAVNLEDYTIWLVTAVETQALLECWLLWGHFSLYLILILKWCNWTWKILEHILGLSTLQAEKCRITEGIQHSLTSGEEYCITVNAQNAGYGAVTCRIRSTSGR
jgi:hypothetical protein